MISAYWQNCVASLREELPAQQFNTWIKPIRVIGSGNTLRLLIPNRFILDWVNDNFLNRIKELVSQQAQDLDLRVVLEIGTDGGQEVLPQEPVAERTEAPRSTAEPVVPSLSESARRAQEAIGGFGASAMTLPQERHNNRHTERHNERHHERHNGSGHQESSHQERHNQSHQDRPQAHGRQQEQPAQARPSARLSFRGELNPNYTFSSFIEGKSNQLARAASAQVASNPGGAYNPLFIYGGVGLGKTHLMHAIGNHLKALNPTANVVYLHSQTFVGSMVSALQLNAINEFKRYYHSADALLIDDIQFFANKERSQEEFFHTFNAIFEGGRQIIMTCDKYHSEINGLEERLKSRFSWGLSVAVEPPELETRAAILINKANLEDIFLGNEEAIFMAQKLRSNVRELEGALKKVVAHSRFMGTPISIPLIKDALKDLLAIQSKLVSVDNIQRTVAEYYKIKMADMISKRRNRSIARPRQMAMCLSKELTNHSLPEIGTMYGGRDHTTVLHACRTINELRKSSTDMEEDYQNLLRSLSN